MSAHFASSPANDAGADILARQKAAFLADMSPTHAVRDGRLKRLDAMILARGEDFARAIAEDFGTRSATVTMLTETVTTRAAIRHARRNLRAWMRPQRAGVSIAFLPGSAEIRPQPLGVVGIIAPWNYPLQLVLSPLVGALAAGNRAMLKPSELTPAFSDVLRQAIGESFAEDEVAVVTGGADVAQAFSALPFDHLLFTGSTAVGRKVAEAAARNLTPVTLELGGKSPAIVDATADLARTASRLIWGKLLNSGQTCVAPDYALVPRGRLEAFIDEIRRATLQQYPALEGNGDYTSIISERHFQRLNGLVEDARGKGAEVTELLAGGNEERRIFAPVVLTKVDDRMAVMQEEIFGPILPVIAYDALDEAIAVVNRHERPLALYWFGSDKAAEQAVLTRTISGGVTINDTIFHLAQEDLPFGGVGASGYGNYHGRFGFQAMSKLKPIFRQSSLSSAGLLYPPYGRLTRWLLKLVGRLA